jgi:hypothetical protein
MHVCAIQCKHKNAISENISCKTCIAVHNDAMDMNKYIETVRDLVNEHRSLWDQMDAEKVASRRYLHYFINGKYENPGAKTLADIEAYIKKHAGQSRKVEKLSA